MSVWYCGSFCFLNFFFLKYQINIFIGVFCNFDILILKINKNNLIKYIRHIIKHNIECLQTPKPWKVIRILDTVFLNKL
jgi:hypothetical protein